MSVAKKLIMERCEQCIVREFSSVKALNKEELIKMSETKTAFNIKKGEAIFNEGDVINGVYCVKEGTCKIVKLGSNGKDSVLKLVNKGKILGQHAVISEEKSSLSAIAVEDMKVCFIPKTEIMNFFNQNNKFSLEITKEICCELKNANEAATSFSNKSVKERLASALLHLHNISGITAEGELKIQLSREEIAGMVGTATESCIRLLADLKKSNHIDLVGKKIILKDIKGLQRISNSEL